MLGVKYRVCTYDPEKDDEMGKEPGGVDAGLFQRILAGATLDTGADAQILEHLSQSADHPIALNFPEGAYLKGLVCLKVEA